eukprot:TRINITY_DN1577_c0_g1_i1.p2 TRINITY_DN1577_c0_g1~~TRINITY_DN1577_c0_g1_i1.p2  ORF type:complete len:272 (+),score=12.80 TRINITY_DN1577_c0_g1_i1:105-818(+)
MYKAIGTDKKYVGSNASPDMKQIWNRRLTKLMLPSSTSDGSLFLTPSSNKKTPMTSYGKLKPASFFTSTTLKKPQTAFGNFTSSLRPHSRKIWSSSSFSDIRIVKRTKQVDGNLEDFLAEVKAIQDANEREAMLVNKLKHIYKENQKLKCEVEKVTKQKITSSAVLGKDLGKTQTVAEKWKHLSVVPPSLKALSKCLVPLASESDSTIETVFLFDASLKHFVGQKVDSIRASEINCL